MRICVLGGTYFIGRHIVNMLLNNGHDVCVVNRNNQPQILDSIPLLSDRGNEEELKQALSGEAFDVIIDISGQIPNHVSNVIRYLKSKPKKIIFISSGSVYLPDNAPFNEESPVGKSSLWGNYGNNKLLCENIWYEYSQSNKVPILILRPPYLYGVGNYLDRETWFVSRYLSNSPIFIPDNPETAVQFLHVEDLALIVTKNISNNTEGIFNVAAPDILSYQDLCEVTGKAIGEKTLLKTINLKSRNLQSRDFFPFRKYDFTLNTTKMFNVLIDKKELRYPNTRRGWLEVCYYIARYYPKPILSDAEKLLKNEI